MNLRLVTLLIVIITFAGLSLVLSVTTREVLTRHFDGMEQQSVLLNLERAEGVVESELDDLERLGAQWAQRTDLEQLFKQDAETFLDLNIELLFFLDTQGTMLYSRLVEESGVTTLTDELAQMLLPGAGLLPENVSQVNTQGIILFKRQPLLLAGQPVLDTQGQPAGALVIGRLIGDEELKRLGSMLRLPLALLPFDDPGTGVERAAYYAILAGKSDFTYALDETNIAGFTRLDTPTGSPAFLLRIEQSRQFYLSGQRVLALINVALITVGLVFAVMTVLFLELMVFSRLTRLSKEVNKIRAGEYLARVTVKRNDELSQLGRNINVMLDSLEQAQSRRIEAQNELRLHVDDLLALNDSSVQLISRLDAPNTLEEVCRLAVEKFGLDLAWIGAPNGEYTWLRPVAAYGCTLEQISPLPLEDPGTETDPALQSLRSFQAVVKEHTFEYAGISLCTQAAFPLPVEVEYLSVLNLYSSREKFFTPNRLKVLEAFSNLASIALQNVNLFHEVQEGRRRQETLSRRLVELQEEERKLIALELHDEIGQILTGLNLMLGADMSSFLPEQRSRLENAHRLVNELIGRVRQMSLTLRPAMLDDLGLLPTLLWHFGNYTRQTSIRVDFHHSDLEGHRFSQEIETTVYRVVQEALTNVARHAAVSTALVQIWVSEETLNVQVEDEGAGFDMERTAQAGSTFGLLGMQERAVLLHGSLAIDSQPGSGTNLHMQLPLEQFVRHKSD